jgi:hypothetical protein
VARENERRIEWGKRSAGLSSKSRVVTGIMIAGRPAVLTETLWESRKAKLQTYDVLIHEQPTRRHSIGVLSEEGEFEGKIAHDFWQSIRVAL